MLSAKDARQIVNNSIMEEGIKKDSRVEEILQKLEDKIGKAAKEQKHFVICDFAEIGSTYEQRYEALNELEENGFSIQTLAYSTQALISW